ncbi:MAG TPA: hypothetical protein VJ873_13390 [bacterium]|nr:hypothetical protein [bacterium]
MARIVLGLRNVVLVTLAFLLLLVVVWYVGFDRNISLPNCGNIRKIEVCQNDFK